MLVRFTLYPVYNMYVIFYAKTYANYASIFFDHNWTLKDFLAFLPFFIIYEVIIIAVLLFVFKICCNRYMYEDRKIVMAYDNFEYTVYSISGRVAAFVLYYWVIKNYIEDELTAYSVLLSLLVPIIILRFYLKKRRNRIFAIKDNKSIFKSVIKLIMPGEILTFVLGLTIFGFDYSYRFGKALAYPAYELFRFTYINISGRMDDITAGKLIFIDYLFYVGCYIIYLVMFTALIYLVAKTVEKKKYRYS